MVLNSKHQKTLDDVFESPVRANILWSDIESLLIALGAEVSEGRGSRVRIALSSVRAIFHRPHPQKETDKGAVKSMRHFLTEAGFKEDISTGELNNNEI
ncbi:type II toxin-antitoxin system HicA family toxin [Nostoc sp. MS1]|uniref:type II toxin-antitoxin system HicA family toxin n=1 Tax=Nostoc sp. MS1 TaxID=2764711 RepID=UPI001CC3504D|nr:type II toxin-antitoxin system HicA family toxin [Nostoc sp. MS1]BCL34986.1 hexulose-6-phosphate isomerase [Nostoc sp. MS1]